MILRKPSHWVPEESKEVFVWPFGGAHGFSAPAAWLHLCVFKVDICALNLEYSISDFLVIDETRLQHYKDGDNLTEGGIVNG